MKCLMPRWVSTAEGKEEEVAANLATSGKVGEEDELK